MCSSAMTTAGLPAASASPTRAARIPGSVVYFPVDDVDGTLARAEQFGAERVLAPTNTPVSRIAVFADPDGNLVGLVGLVGR